jgi:hypothetical protein
MDLDFAVSVWTVHSMAILGTGSISSRTAFLIAFPSARIFSLLSDLPESIQKNSKK